MKSRLAVAAAVLTVPFAAMAQSPAPPAPLPATAPAKPGAGAHTVEGLTVTPLSPSKPCGSRDQQCIALVVAELKRRYPEQLKRFCFQRDMRAIRTQITNEDLLADLGDTGPSIPTAFGVNSALKTACAPDRK